MPNSRNGSSRVVVLGAGIVGASIAYRIAARGFAVTLIDKALPGGGASSHSFAWINAGLKAPLDYHNLNRRSMDMWEQFAAKIADDGDSASVGLCWGGKVSWVTEPNEAERLESEVRQMQAWGYPSRLINAAELRELEPALAVDSAAAAEYSENEAQVEPQMVVDACVRRLSELGGTVLTNTEVVGLSQSHDGRVKAVETTSGAIECDTVALAAGTDVTPLAAMAGVHVPQYRSPGVVIRTNPLPRVLESVPVIYAPASVDGRQEIHIRQCADGRMMIGEGNQESLAEDDSQAHADDLLDRARRFLPALNGARAVPVPVGWRPMPLDGYPIMGFTREAPNMYIALTHSGVTLAPLLSQLAMLEICDGAVVDAVLSPYRLGRFAGMKAAN
ncbi:MAG: FAD-dependent oxidoreductase [Chloroflexota bacterium]|nr:FAD-dependent oxidoreductase [Chloroflexota bacterium]